MDLVLPDGDVLLEGDAGADTLFGGAGSDTYVFNVGDGADTIYDSGPQSGQDSATDKIVLGAGIAPADVSVSRVYSDLVISFGTAGDQIRVANWYSVAS